MPDYDWDAIRDDATQKYGDVPGAELERRILTVFQQRPTVVLEGIDHVGGRYQAGLVRSFWAILALHVEQHAGRGEDKPVNPAGDREKKIARAEQWMRAAGIHFDQPEEVLDELFGQRGQLRAFKDDTFLQQRMLTLWQELRPTGEQIEADTLKRARHWQQTTGRVWNARTLKQPIVDPDQPLPF